MKRLASFLLAAAAVAAWPSARAEAPRKAFAPTDLGGAQAIPVAGDTPTYVLPGKEGSREVLLYLHGRCGNPFAGARSFPEASASRGTMVIVLGDVPCPNSPRRRWSGDMKHNQARIDAALDAASQSLGRDLDRQSLTVVGYSEGALKAEQLAHLYPERYPRVLLIGSPRAPSPFNLGKGHAIVTMVGERDAQHDMREGTKSLEKAGRKVHFWLLPGARHGQYGPEGERVMDEALGWAFAQGGSP
jgi:predicted esterase